LEFQTLEFLPSGSSIQARQGVIPYKSGAEKLCDRPVGRR
jgi:hypothetical protein